MRSPLALCVAVGGALFAAGPVSAGKVVEGTGDGVSVTWSTGTRYGIDVVGAGASTCAAGSCCWYSSYLWSHHCLYGCSSSSEHVLGEGSSSRSES